MFNLKKINKNIFIIFTFIIIILLFIHYFYLNKIENFKNNNENENENVNDNDNKNENDNNNENNNDNDNKNQNKSNIEFVIARYNEDVDFLLHGEFKNKTIYLYNKGLSIKNPSILNAKNIKIIKLPNVGKCDHTYLYHIVNNYNNLADIIIFLPASYNYMDYKRDVANKIISKTIENNNSYFQAKRLKKSNFKELYNFKINKWKTSFKKNQLLINKNKNYNMVLSDIRPYGKWFKKVIDINDKNNINIYKCNYVIYCGIFSIKKNNLKKYSKELYQNLLSYVDKDINPEAGHYIERIWGPLFYPFSKENLV